MATATWTKWDADYGSFTAAAEQNKADTDIYYDDKASYQNRLDAFDAFAATHTPEETLLYFFAMIVTSADPSQHDNIFGLYDDEMIIYGDQMVVNARTTTLTNDLQNLVNDTVSTDEVPVDQQVNVAKASVSQMIYAFENDQDVINAYDPSTVSSILVELNKIQTTLNTYFDPSATPYDPQYPGHEDTKMQSFDDMKNRMSIKDDTGTNNATTAAKEFTDSFQILTSLTQNTNAVLNQKVSEVTGMMKSWQSFVGSLMKSMLSLMSATQNNMSRG